MRHCTRACPGSLPGLMGKTDLMPATLRFLLPLAPLATLAGAWAVTRVNQDLFYRITYAALVPVGIKLIWDGLTG